MSAGTCERGVAADRRLGPMVSQGRRGWVNRIANDPRFGEIDFVTPRGTELAGRPVDKAKINRLSKRPPYSVD